jgi:hypothetical protein
MKYFVSVDKCAFHDWQLELLLESFNTLSLENDLCLATTTNSSNRYPFVSNIKNHKIIYQYEDVGKLKGFRPINELFQLTTFIKDNIISMPLVVLRPHMVIKQKIEQVIKNDKSRAFIFGSDPYFTFTKAVENCGEFWECCDNDENYYRNNWFRLGSVFVLTGMPDWIVNKVIKVAESLLIHQISKSLIPWSETCRLAWIITMNDLKNNIEIIHDETLSSIMNEGKNTVFVDYEHGLPPDFNRLMYKFEPPLGLSLGDPIEALSHMISTPNAHFISKLCHQILKKRKPLNNTSLKK